jgi:hypothetical protein
MTKQHRATPEQWAQQALWAETHEDSDSSCIMELLHRIEVLEAAQQKIRSAPVPPAGAHPPTTLVRKTND